MTDNITRSHWLHESLAGVIAKTKAGERLPSEPQLAKQLKVSRAALREAMRTFETQGIIHRRQGVGTFVTNPPHVIDTGIEVLESIETLAERMNLPVAMGDFKKVYRKATVSETDALGIQAGEGVLVLSRVILVEGRPVAYLIDILPNGMISEKELENHFTGSVLDLLLRRGEPALANSRCEIQAVKAPASVTRALRIKRNDVLLKFTAYLYSVSGQVVDYSHSYFLPGYFRFHVMRRVSPY